jgi:pseudouridine synthase
MGLVPMVAMAASCGIARRAHRPRGCSPGQIGRRGLMAPEPSENNRPRIAGFRRLKPRGARLYTLSVPRKSPDDLPPLTDAARGERLQRVLADAGVASRRDCEALIERGAVEVNGEVVTRLPVWVDPAVDHIVVEGRPLARKGPRLIYVLLNKPARTLTAAEDEPGADRRTVVDLVEHPAAPRLFPVGRLDYDSVGLLLLTNDGELANRLTHPRYGVAKTYKVKVRGQIDDDACRELERGIYLADRKEGKTDGASRTAQVELAVIRRERDATWLELTLREGRNRQVRRMLAAVGYPVLSLERTGMGPLELKGVARGSWRELTAPEVASLKRAAAMGLSGDDAADRAKSRAAKPRADKPRADKPRADKSRADKSRTGKAGPTSTGPTSTGPTSNGPTRRGPAKPGPSTPKQPPATRPTRAAIAPGVEDDAGDPRPAFPRRMMKNAIRGKAPGAPARPATPANRSGGAPNKPTKGPSRPPSKGPAKGPSRGTRGGSGPSAGRGNRPGNPSGRSPNKPTKGPGKGPARKASRRRP